MNFFVKFFEKLSNVTKITGCSSKLTQNVLFFVSDSQLLIDTDLSFFPKSTIFYTNKHLLFMIIKKRLEKNVQS